MLGAEEENNNEEACTSLNTACIIKTPFTKILLKKCTPNGNVNRRPFLYQLLASIEFSSKKKGDMITRKNNDGTVGLNWLSSRYVRVLTIKHALEIVDINANSNQLK